MGVYVDDGLLIGGEQEPIVGIWNIKDRLAVTEESIQYLTQLIGIKFHRIDRAGYRMMLLEQRGYTRTLISRFIGADGKVPAKSESPYIQVDSKDDAEPGKLSGSARESIGGLIFLQRGTRTDIAIALNMLARQVNRWSVGSDKRLRRLFGYLSFTEDLGFRWWVSGDRDENDLCGVTYPDSSHQDDEDSGRSTPGWHFAQATEDEVSWILTDWDAARQTAAQPSSCASETTAIRDSVMRTAFHMLDLMDVFYYHTEADVDEDSDEEDRTSYLHYTDADSSRLVVSGTKPTIIAAVKRHQRLNLHILRDAFAPARRTLRRCDTTLDPSDINTKVMKGLHTFQRHRSHIGLVKIDFYLVDEIHVGRLAAPLRKGRAVVRAAANLATGVTRAIGHQVVTDPDTQRRVAGWLIRSTLGLALAKRTHLVGL